MTLSTTSARTTARTHRRASSWLAVVALAMGGLLAACGSDSDDGSAGDDSTGAVIDVSDAWARTSPMMATAGAAYMTIANTGDADDAVLAASVDESIAGRVELHETRMVDDSDMVDTSDMGDDMDGGDMGDDVATTAPMMEMVHIDRIEVPAGGVVKLEPGGLHVMMFDVVEPLEPGEELEVTLTFEVSGDHIVTAIVGDEAP